MAKITYTLLTFNSSKASQGALVVMVRKDITGSVTNEPAVGTEIQPFNGAGVCKALNNSQFTFSYNSNSYLFNNKGEAISQNALNYKLMLGQIQQNLSDAGSTVNSSTTIKTSMTRGEDDSIDYNTTISDAPSTVLIDQLNARDHFAVQALRAMLEHAPDPSALSDSVMADYCDKAYRWAANMMSAAASTRAVMEDDTASGGGTEEASVGVLSTNEEKLLNNIIVAIEALEDTVTTVKESLNSINTTLGQIKEAIEDSNT